MFVSAMRIARFIPLLLAIIMTTSVILYAQATVPPASTTISLRLGYPDSLDESDVMDLYAVQILKGEGINVQSTYYDAPPLAYEALVAGQQDIVYDESDGSYGLSGVYYNTTCIGGYMLSGTFLAIAGSNITKPSQMIGKTSEDFGPGTTMRYLDEYWFKQLGIPTNLNGPSPGSVYLKNGGENYERVHDLESGVAQMIVVDDFILADVDSPSINNSAHGGPFHVLFNSPDNYYDTCYVARDDWLTSPANALLAEKFLAALYEAQRWAISYPQQYVQFAIQQLPETPVNEIEFASSYYPQHYTYWPYGLYNLQGAQSLAIKFNDTSQFFIEAGVITSPIKNDSAQPFGVINKYFELKALQMIGPYTYPDQSWVNPTVVSDIQSWVPSWEGGMSPAATTATAT
jgi:ABC-type nitrate/sulfonate/bicarbonate transport system substrate-binding protein